MMKYRKVIFLSLLVAFIFGAFIYLETQLPFFKKFLPVGENKLIIIILNINLLLILLLLFLVIRTLAKTSIEKKRGIWGSGLKTKLTVTLVLISAVPSFTLFILATGFFNVSMDRWFSQKIEDTIESALEYSRFYYDDMFQRYEAAGQTLIQVIKKQRLLENEAGLSAFLRRNAAIHGVSFLALHQSEGATLATSGPLREDIVGQLDGKARTLTRGGALRDIIPLSDGELVIAAIPMKDEAGSTTAHLLVGNIIRIHGAERIREIAAVQKEFRESRPFKKILKYSYIIPLFLITILTIFFSLWVGIKMATEITVPIEKMKEGAAIIAKGKFDVNLEDRGKDEIGTLVSAFNSMARELKVAKEEIEERRRYMEVILDNVATGIISTDKRGCVLLLNRAAKSILGLEGDDWINVPLKKIFGDEFRVHLKEFLKEVRVGDGKSVTREMRLNLRKDVTYLRTSLTILKDEANRLEGFIIAFDDITHIVRAEKLATWREVARKLTHEIKNPLTPIMLSAERLRRRLLSRSQGPEKEILDDTTSVIIRSAEDIKGIVNELTKLTHASQARTMEDANMVVEETVRLYHNLYQDITLRFEGHPIPPFLMDKDGIKRVVMNLIANSVKALEADGGEIVVTTAHDEERNLGIIVVTDTGRGVADEDKGRIFDPYFTKDKDGTGLGLAIVHSIVLEHHGRIRVEDNVPRGTRFTIELPILEA